MPHSILYDNTKFAVARILPDGTRERTQGFARLISHYVFKDRFGRPGKGKERAELHMLSTATAVLDWFGVIVFAVTGALVASRKQMDVVGFALLGTVTGIGGGTLRDIFLGELPVFWVREPAYLVTCVLVSCLVFFTAHIPQSRYKVLLWLDAFGLALFAVTGAEKALLAGAGPVVATAMGVTTATFGGIVRDVLGGESPVILTREIYISAALFGSIFFVAVIGLGLASSGALVSGFTVAFAIRGAALYWAWSLPRYRPRPRRDPTDIIP